MKRPSGVSLIVDAKCMQVGAVSRGRGKFYNFRNLSNPSKMRSSEHEGA
jgi:hypothetical protein